MTDSLEKRTTIAQLAEIAMEGEMTNPIEWGELAVEEKQAYQMMASQLLEQFDEVNKADLIPVILATATKLLVENFVLNLKLKGAENVLKDV